MEGRQLPKIMEAIYDEAILWAHAGNRGLQMIMPMQDDYSVHPVIANDVVVSLDNVN
jgi:hypothetical protein